LDIAILCNSGSSKTTNMMPIENATKGDYRKELDVLS